ncbi:hypothetical protein [Paracoccus sulfuroxidans]|uniref:Uncharacterized protein n=1 Tax=Paracoccus sulfuroxidans TaxID=384678 RepID=A0A562NKP5_9RHOB|nr:hypothetical protein [Paracoccus sulfuroxidans]TWI32744.1 hypothetical protein IQ24_02619 [Paracoccus sulfuroxidans]
MGGKQTTKNEIPKYLQEASQDAIARAGTVADLGYTPYYGLDVAAFTPQQNAAFQGANDAAAAFGMGGGAVNMPNSTTQGGISGYSSGGLYDAALAELKRRQPGLYDALRGVSINPQTGAAPTAFAKPEQPQPTQPTKPVFPWTPGGQLVNGPNGFGGFGRNY